MLRPIPRLLLLLLPLLAMSGCADADLAGLSGPCPVQRVASVPLLLAGNFLFAGASLDGVPALLVVDTGAETSVVTPEIAAGLGLARDASRRSVLMGVTETVTSRNAIVRDFRVGPLRLGTRSLGVGPIAPIADLGRPVAGLLGTDVLAQYDVELDPATRQMVLYRVGACQGFVPWGGAAVAIPASLTPSGRLYLPVAVDRQPVRAQLDTGARNSLVTRGAANRVGVSDADLADDPVRLAHGIGNTGIALHRHRFGTVSVGTLTSEDVDLNVADTRLPGVEMLLGGDWIAGKRIWISFAQKLVFVAQPVRRTDMSTAAR